MISHFWVSSYPFFESEIFIVREAPSSVASTEVQNPPLTPNSKVNVYDPDGALINELVYSPEGECVSVLEVDRLLGSCKLESGLKHAHVEIISPPGTQHLCRLRNLDAATMLGSVIPVTGQRSCFTPLVFSNDRSNILCCVNTSNQDSFLRCRLFCGKRNPEAVLSIPAHGSRIMNLELEFKEFSDLKADEQLQAYVRFGTKPGTELGVQLLERQTGAKETNIFSSIT